LCKGRSPYHLIMHISNLMFDTPIFLVARLGCTHMFPDFLTGPSFTYLFCAVSAPILLFCRTSDHPRGPLHPDLQPARTTIPSVRTYPQVIRQPTDLTDFRSCHSLTSTVTLPGSALLHRPGLSLGPLIFLFDF